MATGRKRNGTKSRKRAREDGAHSELITARLNKDKILSERWADFLTTKFGTVWFLNLNILFFAVWIVINLNLIPGIATFDPFPFGLLTMIVSLEAIGLSIIVLVSQNRAAKIDTIREEIDLQINMHAEREITKVLRLLDDIQRHLKMRSKNDPEARAMERALDINAIERRVMERIDG